MPKKTRLTGRDLRETRPAQRLQGDLFSLSVLPLPGRARATVVVSKAVAPKAVDRNRIKRRTRSVIAPLIADRAGGLVFTAKKPSARATFAELRDDIERLFSKLR